MPTHTPMRPRTWTSRRRSEGQALILGLIFTGVAGIMVMLLFNGSMLATTKSQLQNAADAGAYSAALLQARDANFSAYTNRAMIANQVAVAQFVSLKSYFEDAAQTKKRANSVLEDKVYRLFPQFAPAWDIAKKLPVDTAKSAIDSLAPPAVKGLDLLIKAMDQAQELNHQSTALEMMFVVDEVVKANDPQAAVTKSAFMLGDGAIRVNAWRNDQTKQYRANDASKEADRFADLIVHEKENGKQLSIDDFIPNRASVPAAAWASPVKPYLCPGAVFTQTVYGFAHFGGTLLSSNKRRWLGLDATQGGGEWSCTWLVPCPVGTCPVTFGTLFPDIGTSAPFLGGSGGAVAGAGGKYGETSGYKNNPGSSSLYGYAMVSPAVVPAEYRYWSQGPGTTLDSGGGLQDHYRDMADLATKPKDQTPELNGGQYPITVEVERQGATLRDTSKLLPDNDQLKLQPQYKGDTMRALASAHAYFYRSKVDSGFTRSGWKRGDSKTEYQNLLSPYWQARLIPTPLTEEVSAGTLQ